MGKFNLQVIPKGQVNTLRLVLNEATLWYYADSCFNEYDQDHDGILSLEEFKKAVPLIKAWLGDDYFTKNIADDYQAFIEDASERDEGTVFTLTKWREVPHLENPDAKSLADKIENLYW